VKRKKLPAEPDKKRPGRGRGRKREKLKNAVKKTKGHDFLKKNEESTEQQ